MSPNIPPWITASLLWTLIQSTTGLTVSFTQSHSSLRPIAAISTAVFAYLLQTTMKTHFSGTRASGPVVAMCWVNVLNAIDLLVLSRVSYEAQVAHDATKQAKKDKTPPTSATTTYRSGSLRSRLIFSLSTPYNYRRINTPWQIKLPAFDPANPLYVPSKSTFLLKSTLKLVIAGSIIHFLTLDANDPYLSTAITKLNEGPTSILLPFRNRTFGSGVRHLLIQSLFTLSFGIVTRATIVGSHTLGAIISVGTGISEPASWPPIAGSLTEAWTLKRLWGISWHQLLRPLLTSNANFLLSILSIPPSSPLGHWFRIAFAFLGSGAIHSACDMAFGVALDKTGGLWFFGLQIVGIAIEGSVQSLFRSVGKDSNPVRRAIGYIWVSGFLLWTTPVWVNPILVSLWKDGVRIMSPWLGLNSGGGLLGL